MAAKLIALDLAALAAPSTSLKFKLNLLLIPLLPLLPAPPSPRLVTAAAAPTALGAVATPFPPNRLLLLPP